MAVRMMATLQVLDDPQRVEASWPGRTPGPEVQLVRAHWDRFKRTAKACGKSPAAWIRPALLEALATQEAVHHSDRDGREGAG